MTDQAAAPQPDLLAHALAFAASGLPVFPCVAGGKTPATHHGFHDATTDPERIRRWWTSMPQANIGAPTGRPGFDVLDVDVRSTGSGWEALHQLKTEGLTDGWIRAVTTPSGGLHLHYPGTDQRNGGIRGQHLDFRGQGGYVLLPPSAVSVGSRPARYQVAATSDRAVRPLDWSAVVHRLAPTQVPDLYSDPTARSAGSMEGLVRHVERQVEGNRDNALFWAACRAVEGGITDLRPLLQAAQGVGLPEQQARRTLRSAIYTAGRGTGRGREHPPAPTSEPHVRTAS